MPFSVHCKRVVNERDIIFKRERFQSLFAGLYPHILKNDTRFRNTVPVENFATTMYYLSDEDRMMKVVNAFGIGKKHFLV